MAGVDKARELIWNQGEVNQTEKTPLAGKLVFCKGSLDGGGGGAGNP